MYGVRIITEAAAPITAAQLRARLRINGTSEDEDLDEFLGTAVEQFEADTQRPVLSTVYRQDLSRWPASGQIVLGRGGVTEVTAVKRYMPDGSAELLDADQWRAELLTPPAHVQLASIPARVTTAAGIPLGTVGYVEFTAGWASTAAVPKQVLTALKLLAGHFYEHREAFTELDLKELPAGWRRVVSLYRLGLSGDWGQ